MSASLPTLLRRGWRCRGGATAVEFAMAMPILVAMVVGIFQFGWAQHCASSLRFAAEQGARALTLDPSLDEAAVRSLVRAKLAGNADPNVDVALAIEPQSGGYRVARLTATYHAYVGVPTLATYPINFQTVVTAALPAP